MALKHGAMKAGPSRSGWWGGVGCVGGGEMGEEGEQKEEGETVNGKKAIIHFSLSFQALSHIKASQR